MSLAMSPSTEMTATLLRESWYSRTVSCNRGPALRVNAASPGSIDPNICRKFVNKLTPRSTSRTNATIFHRLLLRRGGGNRRGIISGGGEDGGGGGVAGEPDGGMLSSIL